MYICTVQQTKDTKIMETIIKQNIFDLLNNCKVQEQDNYFGFNLVNEFGDVIAYFDGNHNETTYYEDFSTSDKSEIDNKIQQFINLYY